MTTYDFVLLTLSAFGGETRGKTLLQKRCFFVSLLVGQLDEMGFRPHYYGPYSPGIEDAVGQLRGLGFLEERRIEYGVRRDGFEVSRYDYALTSPGTRIAELRKQEMPAEWAAIDKAAAQIRGAGDPEYVELSIAAKAYFLLKQVGGPASKGDLIEMAEGFGWHISQDQMQQAWEFLEKVGHIRILWDA